MELSDYQVAGVERMMEKDVYIQADVMGMGKTAQAIEYMKRTADKKFIVICPASLKTNWQNEINNWLDINVEPDKYDGNIVITNYERMARLMDDVDVSKFGGVICDEAHALKNIDSHRTQVGRELIRRVGNPMLLTGTPILNRPNDLLGLIYVGGKLSDFWNRSAFEYRYMRWVNPVTGVTFRQYNHLEELRDKMQKYICRRTWHDLDMDVYTHWIDKIYIGKFSRYPLVSQSICDIEHVERRITEYRIPLIIDWLQNYLESNDEPVVIFAHHRKIIQELVDKLDGMCYNIGGMEIKERDKQINDFVSGNARGIVCSINCSATGLNFTNAHTIVFVEYPWNKSILNQAIARCARRGQTHATHVFFLCLQNSFDDYRLAQSEVKNIVAENVIDDGVHNLDTILTPKEQYKILMEQMREKFGDDFLQ